MLQRKHYLPTCNSTAVTLPISQRTTFVSWPGSPALQSRSDDLYNSLGLLTGKTEYAYGSGSPGSPVRQSAIAYATLGGGISNRPSSVTVTSGGATVAQTSYTYDSSPLTSVTGIAQHNDASYGTGNTIRGNLTKLQSLVSGTTFLTSSATYDTTGQRLTITDPAGNVVTLSYTDNFFTDNGANPPSVFTHSAPTNAYLTKMIDPIHRYRRHVWVLHLHWRGCIICRSEWCGRLPGLRLGGPNIFRIHG